MTTPYRFVSHHAAHPHTRLSDLAAAALAAGPAAVASHRSAARLWGLRDVPRWRPEVMAPGTRLPLLDGVTVHRTNLLDPLDVGEAQGIRTTTLARTLLDLGAVLPAWLVRLAAEDAILRKLVGEIDLLCVLERVGRRGRNGSATLREIVASSIPDEKLESRLELDLLRLVRSTGLPEPVLQHELVCADGRLVRFDMAWPDRKLGVDAHGRLWHVTKADFEHDLRRDNAVAASGWAHYRFGWTDVQQRPGEVRRTLRAALAGAA